MHFYAWKKGLKTGMYYLRTRPKADAIQFTVDQSVLAVSKKKSSADTQASKKEDVLVVCSKNLDYTSEAVCESCSA